MKWEHLEHLIRAAGQLTQESSIMVIGSQSILGAFPNAPVELLESREADLYPKNRPDKWELIDGTLGEATTFDTTHGAQGVDETTATLPEGWRGRLVRVQNANTQVLRDFTPLSNP